MTGLGIGDRTDAGLHHVRVGHQRGFDLDGGQQVAGDVEGVVHAAQDPDVAVGVVLGAVAGEEPALLHVLAPIGVVVAAGVTPDGARNSGPWSVNHNEALDARRHCIAGVVHDPGADAGQRAGRAAWLELGVRRGGGEDGGAGFGLPPRVHHGCSAGAHVLPEPTPGLRVDGLAHGAQHPDRREVVGVRDAVREPAHEGADQGGRGVVLRDAVAFDDLEVPARVRGVRGAFEDHLGDAVGERAVDLVGVRRDPGEVGGAPVHVLVAECGIRVAEQVLKAPRRLGQVAAGSVHQALGLTGGPGGVHDEQGRLGVERLRFMDVRGVPDGVMPPHVAAFSHGDGGQVLRRRGAVDDQDVLDRVVAGDGGVRVVLDGHGNTATELAVRGHQQLGARVLDAELQGLSGKAAENERVDGADPGYRKRNDDGLGDDREVDDHAVAPGDAQGQQCVGRFGDFALQLCVGDGAAVAGLALEVEGHLVAAAIGYVAVHAVVGDVELAALKPGDLRAFPGCGVGRDPAVCRAPRLAAGDSCGLRPIQAEGLPLPEGDIVRNRAAVTRRPSRQFAVHGDVLGLGRGPSR